MFEYRFRIKFQSKVASGKLQQMRAKCNLNMRSQLDTAGRFTKYSPFHTLKLIDMVAAESAQPSVIKHLF
ncbi:hypothetical protein N6L27_15640 [Leisingera sp. SS27]|uniref:hypothetical protein n=1 Tax=Leisingera sp. SS27 TaxID=2979462 RepID=UPI00232DAB07|nr:hypothetical protein [Leisingera sp. SS27]MDC0659433.1 hypothetical protein [Leisingera sp. SS27]